MDSVAKRRGRPPKAPEALKRHNLTMRVRGDVRQMLERESAKNQRSVSEEIEHRITQTLWSTEAALEQAYGPQAAAIVIAVARAFHEAGVHTGFMKNRTLAGSTEWFRDGWAYNQAIRAVGTVLEAFRPAGPIVPPAISSPVSWAAPAFEEPGRAVAAGLLAAILGRGATSELQEWGRRRREQLGDLAEPAGEPQNTPEGGR